MSKRAWLCSQFSEVIDSPPWLGRPQPAGMSLSFRATLLHGTPNLLKAGTLWINVVFPGPSKSLNKHMLIKWIKKKKTKTINLTSYKSTWTVYFFAWTVTLALGSRNISWKQSAFPWVRLLPPQAIGSSKHPLHSMDIQHQPREVSRLWGWREWYTGTLKKISVMS